MVPQALPENSFVGEETNNTVQRNQRDTIEKCLDSELLGAKGGREREEEGREGRRKEGRARERIG